MARMQGKAKQNGEEKKTRKKRWIVKRIRMRNAVLIKPTSAKTHRPSLIHMSQTRIPAAPLSTTSPDRTPIHTSSHIPLIIQQPALSPPRERLRRSIAPIPEPLRIHTWILERPCRIGSEEDVCGRRERAGIVAEEIDFFARAPGVGHRGCGRVRAVEDVDRHVLQFLGFHNTALGMYE